MSKKNILLVYNSPLNLKNGSNTHILEIAANLAKKTNIVLFAPIGENQETYPHYIVPIKSLGKSEASSLLYQLSYQAHLLFKLVYYCIFKRPSVIYERICGWSFFPAIISKIFNIKYVTEVNGLLVEELHVGNCPALWIKICEFNERRNYALSCRIISVTEGIKQEIIKIYQVSGEKIITINNGANTDLFHPLNKKDMNQNLNLDELKDYVCFVGNLAPWQGVEYLIQASPLILKKQPNTMFLIIGDGTMKEKLLALAYDLNVADKFIFTGSVPYEKVPIYINASSICVVPKKPLKSGYSPLKLYEYMACGKSIIASKVDGFELLEKINCGLLVNPENSVEFSNAVIKLLSDSYLRNKMGIQGRDYVEKHQSWDAVSRKVFDVCEDVLKA